MTPDSKVTIIVEGVTDTTTIVIPLAAKVTFARSEVFGGNLGEEYLALSCHGFYDIDRNYVFSQTVQPIHIPSDDVRTEDNIVLGYN